MKKNGRESVIKEPWDRLRGSSSVIISRLCKWRWNQSGAWLHRHCDSHQLGSKSPVSTLEPSRNKVSGQHCVMA